MALDDNISRFDAKGGDTHEPTASVAGGPSPEVESEELASPPSLLGTRPQIDGFDQVRTKMRARLLAIDPAGLDEAEVLVEPELPTKIGRYTVEDLLGRGGMGVVYLAVDDELERKLAIKLIRGAGGASGSEHARLRQEARAMARLSHPNVVTVHEVGEHDGQLYIAMEYVQGCSLTQWLEMKRRPWREVLAVMLAAGQGLAAAHAAGIVHRDFKPDNILVGDDGRARVADFGLAWTGQGRSPAEAERTESTSIHSGETHELRHTKTGTILGTLAYMAPEQYRGAPPSFAADQFSFCAALYRTLYDHLPFDATSSTHYQARVRSGDVRPAPAGVKVPKAVRAAILRGLAPRPQERWPSLDALLLGLRQRSRPMRWVPLVAVVLATVAALAVALTVLVREQPASGCRPVSEVLAGIWDDQVQERLQRHFASASTPKKSALAWQTIRTALGQHNDRWVLEYTKTCHERSLLRERGDATSELVALEQVLTCLKVERETFAELLNRIGGEGVDDVDAMLAATSLPTPERCRIAPATELGTTDLPINRLRMLRARKLLARSSVDIDLQRLDAARSTIDDALHLAQELSSPALEAESRLALGRAERAGHDRSAARTQLLRARELIQGQSQHRALELRILIQLIDVIGAEAEGLPQAQHLADEAKVLSQALGSPALLEAYLANNHARVLRIHGRYEAATSGYLTAYTLLRQAIGDSAPETIAVRVNLGVVQSLQRQPEAVSVLRHALEQQLSVVGEFHPRTPSILRNLGNALARNGDFEGAAEVMRRAVRLREQLHGDDTPALASDLLGLAKVLREQGQIDEAKQVLARVAQRAQLKPSHQKSLQREQAALVQAVASPDAGE